MPVMEIKILPIGTSGPSVSEALVPAMRLIQKLPGVRYELTAMGTILEADSLEKLYETACLLQEETLKHHQRVVVFTEVDERTDRKLTIEGKVASLEEKL